ncbi:MAG TPA: hypothetical protein VI341_13525, partial [Actinomycetota bacterium]
VAKLKRMATQHDVSLAEIVREAVDRLPERNDRSERFARALAAAGTGHDIEGKTDIAERHDEYLAAIYERDLRKR